MAVVGIDLGTTNSLISVWQNDKSVIIPNALGEQLTPSVVSIDQQGMVLKRIQDTNTKAFGVFLLSIFVPFVHVIIIFGSRPAPLFTGNDPRIRFTDPYQFALDEYVQGQHTQTVRKRVGSFFSALEPSLLSALVFIWLVNSALLFS